jgi:hypothetical protein
MKILAFLLILTTNALSQTIETDTIKVIGRMHSIVNDVPQGRFTFIVDNVSAEQSFIHQYAGDTLIETFPVEDQIYHLHATSDGNLYVTLATTNRLLVIDYQKKEPVMSINKLYAITCVTSKYLLASASSAKFATNESYYKKTGLVLLDRNTLEQKSFLPATFVMDVDGDEVLLKEIINWGRSNEKSKFYLLNLATMEKIDVFSALEGNVAPSSVSLSDKGNYIAYASGTSMLLFNKRTKTVKNLSTKFQYRRTQFINDHQFVAVGYDNDGNIVLRMVDLTNKEEVSYILDRTLLNYGAILMGYSNHMVSVFCTGSKVVQKIKI